MKKIHRKNFAIKFGKLNISTFMNIYQIIRKESFIETIKICEDDNIFVSKTYKEQIPNYEINKFEENAQALSKINYPSILYINKYDINIINNKATLQIISKKFI